MSDGTSLKAQALRQFRHNTDTEGKPNGPFVCAYDIPTVDKRVAELESTLNKAVKVLGAYDEALETVRQKLRRREPISHLVIEGTLEHLRCKRGVLLELTQQGNDNDE